MDNGWSLFFAMAGLVINGAGIVFIAIQVTLARRQMSVAQRSELAELARRRKQATTDAYASTQDYRRKLRGKVPDDWDDLAIAEHLQEIGKGRSPAPINEYLGHMETLSVAVACGIYDIEVMDSLCGPRLINIMNKYRSYITSRRKEIGYDGFCAELEWLCNELEQRNYSEPPYTPLARRGE